MCYNFASNRDECTALGSAQITATENSPFPLQCVMLTTLGIGSDGGFLIVNQHQESLPSHIMCSSVHRQEEVATSIVCDAVIQARIHKPVVH
jgi:hypothetical protein